MLNIIFTIITKLNNNKLNLITISVLSLKKNNLLNTHILKQ